VEPHSTFGGLFLLAVRQQLSVIAIVQALLVAGITASVTTYATAQRVDERLKEVVQEIRDIRQDHSAIRERITRVESRVEATNNPWSGYGQKNSTPTPVR